MMSTLHLQWHANKYKRKINIQLLISLFSYAVPTIATNVNEHYFLATIFMSTKIPGWIKNDS